MPMMRMMQDTVSIVTSLGTFTNTYQMFPINDEENRRYVKALAKDAHNCVR
jgi:hypothetical protein